MKHQELTITQMAAQSGLSAHTLRYYERIGLIEALGRNASGHRRYRLDDIAWVEFLTRLRDTGMPIRQMKLYADLRAKGPSTARERRQLLESHQKQLIARKISLTTNIAVLDDKIATYHATEAELDQQTHP